MENEYIVEAKSAEFKINDSNIHFYEKIEVETFKDFAQKIGLEKGADIDVIYPLIEGAKSLVEIGAGYGRALGALLEKRFTGSLFAIERVERLAQYIENSFAQKVKVYRQDAREIHLPYQVDCMLWLWSGIMEMSKTEYTHTFDIVYQQLNKEGKFIVETPYKEVRVLGEEFGENHFILETEWGTIDAYLPRADEIRQVSRQIGFQKVEEVVYQTGKGIDRILYVLYK